MNWLRRFFGAPTQEEEPALDALKNVDVVIYPSPPAEQWVVVSKSEPAPEEITAEVEYSLVDTQFTNWMRGSAKIKYSDGTSDSFSYVYRVSDGEKKMRADLQADVKKHVELYKKRKAGKGTWTEKM